LSWLYGLPRLPTSSRNRIGTAIARPSRRRRGHPQRRAAPSGEYAARKRTGDPFAFLESTAIEPRYLLRWSLTSKGEIQRYHQRIRSAAPAVIVMITMIKSRQIMPPPLHLVRSNRMAHFSTATLRRGKIRIAGLRCSETQAGLFSRRCLGRLRIPDLRTLPRERARKLLTRSRPSLEWRSHGSGASAS
jgi:hypothetical protein